MYAFSVFYGHEHFYLILMHVCYGSFDIEPLSHDRFADLFRFRRFVLSFINIGAVLFDFNGTIDAVIGL